MLSTNSFILILSVGILLFSIPSASSIKCYFCTGEEHKVCNDKPTKEFLIECTKRDSLEPTGCTIVHSVDINPITSVKVDNVKRDCYYGDPKLPPNYTRNMGCDELIIYNYIPLNCTICTTDECNSATSLGISSITILIASILISVTTYIF